jgi:transcription elongation GreA/GreB family factor
MATKKKAKAAPSTAAATASSGKLAALQAVTAKLQQDLDDVLRAARDAHEAATHEEAKPENDKDTRGLVESYLAAGQAARAAELQRDLQGLKALALTLAPTSVVVPGAVVALRDDDTDVVTTYFVLPAGAGTTVDIDGARAQVVTPLAPLCRALMGRRRGDAVEMTLAGKARSFVVETVG